MIKYFALSIALATGAHAMQFPLGEVTGADFTGIEPQITLHVSQTGKEGATGAEDEPFPTIAAAASLVQKHLNNGQATRLVIGAGTWREDIPDFGAGETPLFLEGDGQGETIISGSDIFSTWESITVNGHPAFRSDWPHNLYRFRSWNSAGPNYESEAVANYRQVLFLDGQLQRQVLAKEDLVPGTYFVDEGDLWSPDGHIIALPPQGIDFPAVLKEAAVRGDSQIVQPNKEERFNDYVPGWPPIPLLQVRERSNVSLRNLTFQHGSNRLMPGAVEVNNSKNVLMENVRVRWNNGGGLKISRSENVTVRDSDFSHNGGSGVTAHHVANSTWENNTFNENNWRGFWGGYVRYAIAGIKIHYFDGAIFRNNEISRNYADGFWIDLMNKGLLVEDNKMEKNLRFGIFHEVSWGGGIFRRNLISQNGGGFIIKGSYGNVIEDNTFHENAIAVFNERRTFQGDPLIQPLKVWDPVPRDWVIRNNKFYVKTLNPKDYAKQIESGIPGWFTQRVATGSEPSRVFSMGHPRPQQFEFMKTLTWENNTIEAKDGITEMYTIASHPDFHTEEVFLSELKDIRSGKIEAPTATMAETGFTLTSADPELLFDFTKGGQQSLAGLQRQVRDLEFKTDEKTGGGYLFFQQGFFSTEIRLGPEVESIKVSMRIKAQKLDEGAKLFQQPMVHPLFQTEYSGQPIGNPHQFLALTKNTDEWVDIEATYPVPEGASRIKLRFGRGPDPADVSFSRISIKVHELRDMEEME